MPCHNTAANCITDFDIDINDHITCERLGRIIGVYHSHPNGPAAFSPADIQSSEELELPFYLYDVKSQTWLNHVPSTYSPAMEGRRFVWGFEDCYETCRHHYRKLGIRLGDYDRDDTFDETDSNAILENLWKEGFELLPPTTPVQPNDALLFKIGPGNPRHLAVFLGNQRMLHHPLGMLSHIDFLTGTWLRRLKHVIRYKPGVDCV